MVLHKLDLHQTRGTFFRVLVCMACKTNGRQVSLALDGNILGPKSIGLVIEIARFGFLKEVAFLEKRSKFGDKEYYCEICFFFL